MAKTMLDCMWDEPFYMSGTYIRQDALCAFRRDL